MKEYRLKVKYRSTWKYSRVIYPTIEDAISTQLKLRLMGVSSVICDHTGKAIQN